LGKVVEKNNQNEEGFEGLLSCWLWLAVVVASSKVSFCGICVMKRIDCVFVSFNLFIVESMLFMRVFGFVCDFVCLYGEWVVVPFLFRQWVVRRNMVAIWCSIVRRKATTLRGKATTMIG